MHTDEIVSRDIQLDYENIIDDTALKKASTFYNVNTETSLHMYHL